MSAGLEKSEPTTTAEQLEAAWNRGQTIPDRRQNKT